MRLRCEVKDSIDLVTLQTIDHILWTCHVSVHEAEVRLILQQARIVPRAAVVELVEGDNSVRRWILRHQMSDEPRGDEAFTSGDQNVVDIWERVEATLSSEYWCVSPKPVIREEP